MSKYKKNKSFIQKIKVIMTLSVLLNSCYEYKFNSIIKINIEKKIEKKSNINVIFRDGFLIRGGYNWAMKGISEELQNCNSSERKIVIDTGSFQLLNYKSKEQLPLNEKKIDMILIIDSFEENTNENIKADLIAYSNNRRDILFRINFDMVKSIAPFYKSNFYQDPGLDSGIFLGKEICNLILETQRN